MKALKMVPAFIVLLVAMGCTTNVSQSYSPSGKVSYKITCNNAAAALADCYQKAGEICKESGYSVISRHQDPPFAGLIAECKD